ncbi:hypothetical protein FDECE_15389 [Fusarium decemcellulare]|nr:hypothetical protein FDECE_15389 [Fusarium decemcellulare]
MPMPLFLNRPAGTSNQQQGRHVTLEYQRDVIETSAAGEVRTPLTSWSRTIEPEGRARLVVEETYMQPGTTSFQQLPHWLQLVIGRTLGLQDPGADATALPARPSQRRRRGARRGGARICSTQTIQSRASVSFVTADGMLAVVDVFEFRHRLCFITRR